MTLAEFTTKIKGLMKTLFLHKKGTSPVFADSYVPVTYENGNNKEYYPSTITGTDLEKLSGAGTSQALAGTTIAGAISTLSTQTPITVTLENGWTIINQDISICNGVIYISLMVRYYSTFSSGVEKLVGRMNTTLTHPIGTTCETEDSKGIGVVYINVQGQIYVTPVTATCNRFNICISSKI